MRETLQSSRSSIRDAVVNKEVAFFVRDVTSCQSRQSEVIHRCTPQTKIATFLEQALKLPHRNYNFSLCGKRVNPDQTLSEANLRPFQTLTVSLPLVGGSQVMGLLSAEALGIEDQALETSRFTLGEQNATEEQRTALRRLLKTTDFYNDLALVRQQKVEDIFTVEQIEKIKQIDIDKGFVIINSQGKEENAKADEWTIRAFNLASVNTKLRLVKAIGNDMLAKTVFEDYLIKINDKDNNKTVTNNTQQTNGELPVASVEPQCLIPRVENLDETQTSKKILTQVKDSHTMRQQTMGIPISTLQPLKVNEQNSILSGSSIHTVQRRTVTSKEYKTWAKIYQLDASCKEDREFVRALRNCDESALIPALPKRMRLIPIIDELDWGQKLRVLDECREDKSQASTFLKAIRSSTVRVDEQNACEVLEVFWPEVSNHCAHEMIKSLQNPSKECAEQFVQKTMHQALKKITDTKLKSQASGKIARLNFFVKESLKSVTHNRVEARNTFCKLWNCLTHKMRTSLAIEIFERKSAGDQGLEEAYAFYYALDLDSRAELYSFIGDTKLKEFFEEVKTTKSQSHFESESLHHRFFHLREPFLNIQPNEKSSNTYEELGRHVKSAEQEQKRAWQYVPFDMPGDYLQCMPLPESDDCFIVVQPYTQKRIQEETQVAQVTSTKQSSKSKKKKCQIDIQQDQEDLIRGETYSIVSFWKYEGEQKRTFECYRSFSCPKIIPFLSASGKKHRNQYLFKGQSHEVFFVCENESPDNKDLYLCQIDLINRSSRIFLDNVKPVKVEHQSDFYKFMMPNENFSFCRSIETRFHQSNPRMIDAGVEAGKFIAFSDIQIGKKAPTLSLFSLKEEKVVLEVTGAELFIDFVANLSQHADNMAKGQLYFQTDEYFFDGKALQTMRKPQDVQKRAMALNNAQIMSVEVDLSSLLNKDAPLSLTKKNSSDNYLQVPDGANIFTIDAQENGNEKADFDQLDVQEVFSRKNHWVTKIEPHFRSTTTGKLFQFSVTAVDHVTKDMSVFVLNLMHQDSEGSSTIKGLQSLKDQKIQASFISKRLGQVSMIQTTVIDDSEAQEIRFHILDQEKMTGNPALDSKLKFKPLESQKMQVPAGQCFLPQEMSLCSNYEDVLGCYIDRQLFALHWFHEKLSNRKFGDSYQTEKREPLHVVEYPLLCYTGPFPDKRELTIVNLADKLAPRLYLKLQDMQVLSFVQHRTWSDYTLICFLTEDSSSESGKKRRKIMFNTLSCEKMFQKHFGIDMSLYSLEKQWLGNQADQTRFRKQLAKVIKIEVVHELKNQSEIQQCFVIQCSNDLFLYTNGGQKKAQLVLITAKEQMQPIRLVRGYNNTFYFVERDPISGSDVIKELKIFKQEDKFYGHSVSNAHELFSGKVIALENDQNNEKILDSCVLSNGTFGTRQVYNRVFFIDDLHQLQLLQQNEHDYKVDEIENLAELPSLTLLLRNLQVQTFPRVSVSLRCITINHKTINLKSNHAWDFHMNLGKEHNFDKEDDLVWSVSSSQSISSSNRQLMITKHYKQAQSGSGEQKVDHAFVVKPMPGSRKVCLLGTKGVKAIELIQFTCNDLLLIKMHGNYWTCIDKIGQIREIPQRLHEVLTGVSVEKMSTKRLFETNQVLLILVAPQKISSVLFDHRGQICKILQYKGFTDAMTNTTLKESSVTVLSDEKGTMYRVCNKQNAGQDRLEQDVVQDYPDDIKVKSFKAQKDNKKLYIVSLSYSKPKSTVFVCCGDYLCWLNPEENCMIHFIALEELRKDSSLISKDNIKTKDLKDYLGSKSPDMTISQAPISTILTQRSQDFLDYSKLESLNRNLLQLTVHQRAVVYDLENDYVLRDFSDMCQLLEPDNFIRSEVNIQHCQTDDLNSQHIAYRLREEIVVNKANDFFVYGQHWRAINAGFTSEKGQPVLGCVGEKEQDEESKQEPHILPTRFFGAYNTYCEADYQELNRVHKELIEKESLSQLDLQAILSTYQGHSIFDMQEQVNFYGHIEQQLRSSLSKMQLDGDSQEIEHHLFKSLHQILITPQAKLFEKICDEDFDPNSTKKQFLGMFSVLEMLPYSQNVAASNKLLEIANVCNETSLISFCDMQADTEKLMGQSSHAVTDILTNSFFESAATKLITQLEWPEQETFVAFQHHSCLLSLKEVQAKVDELSKKKLRPLQRYLGVDLDKKTHEVNVRLLDIGWLYSNKKSFLEFIQVLDACKRSDLLMTDFVKTLLEVFWEENKWQIFWRIFIPYVMYLALTMYYMINVVCIENTADAGNYVYIGVPNMICVCKQLQIEWVQLFNSKEQNKFKNYFSSPVNVADLIQYALTTMLICLTISDSHIFAAETRRIMCSLLMFLVWAKMFDWLRMFDATSFYIKLIVATIFDIAPFFMIFPIFLLTIGTSLHILNINRIENQEIISSQSGWWLFDSLINQYLLSLGEFDLENIAVGPQSGLVYFFFFFGTFFTQVTALNMIIAIMSDTYGKVSESQQKHSREMKISLMSGYVSLINKSIDKESDSFLVVVTPVSDMCENSEWEGSINVLRNSIETQGDNLKAMLDEKFARIQELVTEQSQRQSMHNRETIKQIAQNNKDMSVLSHKMDEMFSELLNKVAIQGQKSEQARLAQQNPLEGQSQLQNMMSFTTNPINAVNLMNLRQRNSETRSRLQSPEAE